MYLIIGVWGGAERIKASYKFFLYTLLGSVLMLIAMLYMAARRAHDLDPGADGLRLPGRRRRNGCSSPSSPASRSSCRCGRSTPGCPTRTSRRRPPGSVILAGVLLKLGGYGFIRFSLPMFPEGSAHVHAADVRASSAIAVVYTSLVALVQRDMKKLIAYSSVAHMAFVTFGLFAMNRQGIEGAMHGHAQPRPGLGRALPVRRRRLRPAAHARDRPLRRPCRQHARLCLAVHGLHHGQRRPAGHQRLRRRVPEPGRHLSRVELGGDRRPRTGIILGAAYMLWLYWRICFGTQRNADAAAMPDLSAREWWLLAPIAAAVFWMGIYPESFLRPMRNDVGRLLDAHRARRARRRFAPDARQGR